MLPAFKNLADLRALPEWLHGQWQQLHRVWTARRIRRVRMCMREEQRLHHMHMELLEAELDALERRS